MDRFEIEPYRLSGKHRGKWAVKITRISRFGTDEQPFHGGPNFDSEQDALRYEASWALSRGGQIRRAVAALLP
jgi:hypothetical protein